MTDIPSDARHLPGRPRNTDTGSRALWLALSVVVAVSFAALLYFGAVIYQMAPPIPEQVVSTEGDLLFTGDDIRAGHDV